MHQLKSPLPTSNNVAEQRQALDDRADMGNSMKPGGLFTNMPTGSPDLKFMMFPHPTPATWIGIEEHQEPLRQEPLRPSKISRIRSRTLSVLRMLTNSTSSTSQAESHPSAPPVSLNPPTPPSSPKTIIHSPIQCPPGLSKKKSYFRLPPALEPTVVHRTKFKSRPSIISNDGAVHEVTQIPSPLSTSTGDSSTNSSKSGKSSGEPRPSQSTGKTSVESKLSNKTKNRSPRSSENKKVTASPKQLAPERESIEGGYLLLTPIAEVEAQPAPVLVPTYITVEKAAATKAFLECHYNSLTCGQVSPRSVRRRKLECQLYENGDDLAEMERRRQDWATRETDHLRELRVMKIRGANALKGKCRPASMYEVVKILGKGSFGVVRLVRERPENDACQDPQKPKEVYAMKVIRKSDMLRNSQEAHLRAERDFLVAAEHSKWVVPLIASFQDVNNLYLVMDYMPGGDFLGLLIRDNVLSEHDTRFYIAEMILCVEEAHSLQWVHRDVKPDNFLITSSGHLKISDFGLAFDGHWSHDQAYYNNHRQSLLNKLGITIEGDSLDRKEGQKIADAMKTAQNTTVGQNRHEFKSSSIEETEGILNWRNRHGNRAVARSVVGTSQYMAPEVVRGDSYDARCDWWSVAIILYECLYGHTPFLAEEGGRQQTKINIVNHRDTFIIPNRPVVSTHCKDLMSRILVEKEERLCSPKYTHGSSFRVSGPCRDYAGRFVYDEDARDIKAHKWFRGIDWAHLHEQQPPFVPNIKTKEDTHYFDEEESISDFSPSVPDKEPDVKEIEDCLRAFNREIKILATSFIERPYDSARLRKVEKEIDRFAMNDHEKEYLKRFVKHYGKKEKKRPRDRLLRDKETAGKAMEIRKKNAFLGYTYRRVRVEKSIGRCGDFAASSYKRRKVWHRAALSM